MRGVKEENEMEEGRKNENEGKKEEEERKMKRRKCGGERW